jgi:hypothetical protein
MRSLSPLFLIVAVSCARPSLDLATTPARPDSSVASAVTGLWSGTVYESEADPGSPFTLVQVRRADGTLGGQMAFAGARIPLADVTVIEATADTYVALVGPYRSELASSDVVARIEASRDGDTLTGTLYARPVKGGRAYKGRFTAERTPLLEPI